ncbi:unnamed protein product [Boreogadus saida]
MVGDSGAGLVLGDSGCPADAARYSGPFNDIRGPWRRRVKSAEPESLAVHTGRYRLEGPGEGKQQANRQALERSPIPPPSQGVWPLSLTL